MNKIRAFIRAHGTKALGFLQITVAGLAVPGAFPDHLYPKLLALSGVLTAWRGFINSASSGK